MPPVGRPRKRLSATPRPAKPPRDSNKWHPLPLNYGRANAILRTLVTCTPDHGTTSHNQICVVAHTEVNQEVSEYISINQVKYICKLARAFVSQGRRPTRDHWLKLPCLPNLAPTEAELATQIELLSHWYDQQTRGRSRARSSTRDRLRTPAVRIHRGGKRGDHLIVPSPPKTPAQPLEENGRPGGPHHQEHAIPAHDAVAEWVWLSRNGPLTFPDPSYSPVQSKASDNTHAFILNDVEPQLRLPDASITAATPESEAPLAQPTLPLHQQLPDPVVPAELTEDNDTVAVQEDPVALVHRFLNLMGTRQQECQAFREKLRQIHDKYYAEIDRLAYHYMMGLPPV